MPGGSQRFKPQARRPLFLHGQFQLGILLAQFLEACPGVRNLGFHAILLPPCQRGLLVQPPDFDVLGRGDPPGKDSQQEAGRRSQAYEHHIGYGGPVKTAFQKMHVGEIWQATSSMPARLRMRNTDRTRSFTGGDGQYSTSDLGGHCHRTCLKYSYDVAAFRGAFVGPGAAALSAVDQPHSGRPPIAICANSTMVVLAAHGSCRPWPAVSPADVPNVNSPFGSKKKNMFGTSCLPPLYLHMATVFLTGINLPARR